MVAAGNPPRLKRIGRQRPQAQHIGQQPGRRVVGAVAHIDVPGELRNPLVERLAHAVVGRQQQQPPHLRILPGHRPHRRRPRRKPGQIHLRRRPSAQLFRITPGPIQRMGGAFDEDAVPTGPAVRVGFPFQLHLKVGARDIVGHHRAQPQPLQVAGQLAPAPLPPVFQLPGTGRIDQQHPGIRRIGGHRNPVVHRPPVRGFGDGVQPDINGRRRLIQAHYASPLRHCLALGGVRRGGAGRRRP